MSRRISLLLATLLLAAPVAQAAPSADARREIAQLISSLDGSQCRFQRNGSWYDGSDARAHLQRKYDYLLKKDMVDSRRTWWTAPSSSSSAPPARAA